MDLIRWLVAMGMEVSTAALWGTCGLFGALVLLGVAGVAYKEGYGAHRDRTPKPRGATRHKLGS